MTIEEQIKNTLYSIIATPQDITEYERVVESLTYSRKVGCLMGIQIALCQITQYHRLCELRSQL